MANKPGLDAQGQVDFLLCVQQGNLADLLQVVLDRVGGGAGDHDLLLRGVVFVGGEDKALGVFVHGRCLRGILGLVVRLDLFGVDFLIGLGGLGTGLCRSPLRSRLLRGGGLCGSRLGSCLVHSCILRISGSVCCLAIGGRLRRHEIPFSRFVRDATYR